MPAHEHRPKDEINRDLIGLESRVRDHEATINHNTIQRDLARNQVATLKARVQADAEDTQAAYQLQDAELRAEIHGDALKTAQAQVKREDRIREMYLDELRKSADAEEAYKVGR